MYKKKNINGTTMTIPVGIGLGVAVSILLTLLGSAAVAWMVMSETVGEGATGYLAMIILAIATTAGVFVAATLTKRLRLQICMLTGVFFYLLLLGITALFFGGQYQGMGVTALIVMAFSALIAFLPAKKFQIGKYKKKVYS